jgi:hypothetical protein
VDPKVGGGKLKEWRRKRGGYFKAVIGLKAYPYTSYYKAHFILLPCYKNSAF